MMPMMPSVGFVSLFACLCTLFLFAVFHLSSFVPFFQSLFLCFFITKALCNPRDSVSSAQNPGNILAMYRICCFQFEPYVTLEHKVRTYRGGSLSVPFQLAAT
jgi:hypothetical protein